MSEETTLVAEHMCAELASAPAPVAGPWRINSIDRHALAREQYRQVWHLLSENESHLPQRFLDLETVVPLSEPHPYRYANFKHNPD